MNRTIKNAYDRIQLLVQISGDGWLPEGSDPFRYDDHLGARIFAISAQDENLTWGILGSTLKGIQDCVIYNGWSQGVVFQIFDGPWGHVGNGNIVGTGPWPRVTDVTFYPSKHRT